MRKFFTCVAIILAASSLVFAQEVRGTEAGAIAPGADHVWVKDGLRFPKYVHFDDSRRVETGAIANYISRNFNLVAGVDGWRFLKRENDKLGHTHERYQQTYRGIPVAGSMVIVHSEHDRVYSFNGEYYALGQSVATSAAVSEEDALASALNTMDAEIYKWEVPGEESYLQRRHAEDPVAFPKTTHYPEGELVIVPNGGDFDRGDFRLAWKFDVYAQVPVRRADMFVDALSGEVICEWNKIHTADSVGTANTRYSGVRSITTDFFNNSFRMRESGRGNGINTWNMVNDTDIANAVDFIDNDNNWDFAGRPALDNASADAHWGAEMTYDYFFQEHGRNSIDDNGFTLESYVNYGQNFQNAFWDGRRMTYGSGGNRPFTAIDIAGHEIAHGLTTFTADLIYQNESGALNESFSDIFGKAIEHYGRPNNFSWGIGADIGAFRDMSDPNRFNDPANYEGNFWFTGTADNGGVHINSGVQNYWFYLLVVGDSGTNDFNEAYNVPRIDWDTAGAVAFRNLTVYLTRNSQYEDARFFAIQSAVDLYGKCTRVHEAVTNAWHAVGIGRPFSYVPVSEFEAVSQNTCSQPYEIRFLDKTLSAEDYTWNFGDGGTASVANPTHTYTNPGQYTVTLRINGICGGADTITKTNYITIDQAPDAPVVTPVGQIPCRGQASLTATASNTVHWYNDNDELLGISNTFQTPALNQNTTFYARNIDLGQSQLVGPRNGAIGTGGFHNSAFAARLDFEVFRDCRLTSAWVTANTAGNRTFILEDNQGNILRSVTVNVPAGGGRVDLNLDLRPGLYRIGGENMDLYRNNGGVNFPYTIPGLLSITGSSAGDSFFYYLYDWEVNELCASEAVPVTVNVDPLVDPAAADVTRCGAGQITLSASHPQGDINWYDANGTLLQRGNTFTTQTLGASRTFFVEAELGPTPVNVGPSSPQAAGGGSYFDVQAYRALYFEVFQSIRLRSALVDANTAGPRNVQLYDAQGNLLETLNISVPAGQSRVTLNLDLEPGQYFLGGSNMDMFRNNGSATFPYEYPGLVSINGSNATRDGFYYFFYDWEIQEAPCYSNRIPVQAIVQVGTGPNARFSYSNSGRVFQFNNQSTSTGTTYFWDFGDGNTSTAKDPNHTYASPGFYTVTLVVNDGTCSETTSQQVEARLGVSIEPEQANILELYPNPGNGSFLVTASLPGATAATLDVFDALGRKVYGHDFAVTNTINQTLNLEELPSGTYYVRLQAAGQIWTRKYLLK